jgi:fatty-acyl-CoA synthase
MQTRHYGVWPEGQPFSLPPAKHSVFENLALAAERDPVRTAIWYYGQALSYQTLLDQVQRLAGYLTHVAGIRANDRVALYLQNAPQFVIAYYAILAANAVIVPINPMSRRVELGHILSDSGARSVVFGEELGEELAAVTDQIPDLAKISVRYRDYAASVDDFEFPPELNSPVPSPIGAQWRDVLATDHPPPQHTRTPEDWCIIPYSSGTTGLPKGCLHTHSSVQATIRAYPGWVGFAEGSRVLATLPFSHVTGMQNSMNVPILTGSTIYLTSRWNAALAARIIQDHRIEQWRAITTMMIDFLSLPGAEEMDFSSLKAIGGGGAQMPDSVAQKMADLIGLDFLEAYGLSETMAPSHMNPPGAAKKQCLGIPIYGVDSRVIDPQTLVELGPNQPGEIVTHGPQVFLGYWNRPEETEAAFIEIGGKRFLRTGDIGFYDEDGYFFFTDRLKRMVNVSGLKVWPAEVEAILHGHPDIAEACIVSDPDPRTGERVRAVIVPKAGLKDLAIPELTEWCRQNMAAYKVPKTFEFRETLPRFGPGKVRWKDL